MKPCLNAHLNDSHVKAINTINKICTHVDVAVNFPYSRRSTVNPNFSQEIFPFVDRFIRVQVVVPINIEDQYSEPFLYRNKLFSYDYI